MRALLQLYLVLLLGAVAPAAWGQAYEARVFTAADGTSLPYRLLRPAAAEAGGPHPLVLFLHGAGERGDDNSAQLKHGTTLYLESSNRTAYPCFVLVPQCPRGQQWANLPWSGLAGRQTAEPSQPMQAVLELAEQLGQDFAIDPDRVYVTGLSMGGYGTWDLVTRFPGRFAAAVPICGGGDEWAAGKAASTPVWAFHSADDAVVKVDRTRNMIAVVRAGGGRPHYTEYNGLGHESWTTAYAAPEFLPWLFSQRRGRPDTYAWTESSPPVPDVTDLPETDRALPGSGPIRRYDWFKNLWHDRRQAWLKHREQDQGAVVFLGDSITQGWGNQMGNSFPGLKVANRGISGDTTRGVIIRLQEDVLALEPRGVVLLIGTNDLEEGASPETIADNVRLILAMLKAHNPRLPVVLCRVFPSSASKSRPADQIQQVNELYAELAETQPQVTLIDTWTPFANVQGDAKPEEFPDLLHPNEAGYRIWAATLRPELRRLQLLPGGRLAQAPPEPPADERPAYTTSIDHHPDGIGKFYLGREIAHVMGHAGISWLERTERQTEERPDLLLPLLKIKPGDVVADVGAGSGYHTRRLAREVGKEGKVYAVDIQPEMLASLSERMREAGLTNVAPVLGTENDPGLPANHLDLVLLVDVYHEFSYPYEMMQAICGSLKPGGRVALVEFRADDPGVPIKALHTMTESQVRKEMAVHPLQWVETLDSLPWQTVVVFVKSDRR